MSKIKQVSLIKVGIRILCYVLILWGTLALFACTMADKLIFAPPRASYGKEAPQLTLLTTEKGESIAAFYFEAKPGKPTILYSHGNAEDIGQSSDLYEQWTNLGWGVLAYDYPGYGQSSGKPTEKSCERAISSAWNYLTEKQNISNDDIVIIGRSVGSGPAVWLASKHSARSLVLISPFTSTYAVSSPAQYILPGNRFPNKKRIRKIETPLLVVHGQEDGIITANHGRELVEASAARQKKYVALADVGHNDLYLRKGLTLLREIEDFIGSNP